ncbi:hypothetical protein Bbelb_019530 [Branchiostoma belcheri]|nr:hypothetical protein Bbelb_019530 [Branchiostoma belcheri]
MGVRLFKSQCRRGRVTREVSRSLLLVAFLFSDWLLSMWTPRDSKDGTMSARPSAYEKVLRCKDKFRENFQEVEHAVHTALTPVIVRDTWRVKNTCQGGCDRAPLQERVQAGNKGMTQDKDVGYGGTEFVFLTSTAAEMVAEGKGTTVGKLLQHAEIKIVGKDGQVVPLGQEGEVLVRAYSLFNCYRADKEKTAKALTGDGWYKTGDVGALDEKGVLKLLGRVSDMIIRDSYNVHPTVIESSLSKHPKVQDVRVVGVPDPASVEEICACIILNEGQIADSQEMTSFCAEIGLVPIETPGYFLFMDAFPMTSTQRKVDRKKLRLVAMERLGLKEEA